MKRKENITCYRKTISMKYVNNSSTASELADLSFAKASDTTKNKLHANLSLIRKKFSTFT